MDPKDDPEARIRELERPLADAARASELGVGGSGSFPPPPPGPPAPWPGYETSPPYPGPPRRSSSGVFLALFGAVAMILIAGGAAAFVFFSTSGSDPTDAFSDSESTTIRPSTVSPNLVPEAAAPTKVPPGQTLIVSGIKETRTIECQGNNVIVSGIENRLEITGHCLAVTVSGVENTVAVEAADTIGVSGFENRVTFRSGQPEVSNSGQSNVVEQG
ncbi:DUF3060 domain-containing protein [Mycobacterium sp. TNTM28]|uniref:DUF3060 domain-containing protein n=1 Tax=[Mycobacterium] fortunisiensis TaxID=2600579 RepID=A0ABS6KSF6_9MYCO|nr:DUF3060 domain-containing protein [[Mycobacterium] fortunisiensis]MBU9766449.1 DUF3060 domain-containing protein [[Mycobacterium] fortunisiensis]